MSIPLPKYSRYALENITFDDPEFVEKTAYKYGYSADAVKGWYEDLSKKDYTPKNFTVDIAKSLGIENQIGIDRLKAKSDIATKYQIVPNVNILSKGGKYQKYDDIINKVLSQGQATTEDNAVLDKYYNELLWSVEENKDENFVTAEEYKTLLSKIKNYDVSPWYERVGKTLGAIGMNTLTAPAALLNKDARNVIYSTTGDLQEQSTAGFSETGRAAWSVGSSVAQNIINYTMFGGLAPASLSLQAGTQQVYDVEKAGGTAAEAWASGLLHAAAEYGFEKINLKGLQKIARTSKATFKGVVKSALGEIAKEATEETLTEISNILSDFVILDIANKDGASSELTNYFNEYLKENSDKTNNEAFWSTFGKALKQIGMAGLSGGIAGGIMGGGVSAYNSLSSQGRQNTALYGFNESMDNAFSEYQKTRAITPKTRANIAAAQNLLNKRMGVDVVVEAKQVTPKTIKDYIYQKDLMQYGKTEAEKESVKRAFADDKVTKEELENIQKFAIKTKSNISYIYADNKIKGYFDGKNTVINLAVANKAFNTAVHEYVHNLKDNSPEQFTRLVQAVTGLKQYQNVINEVTETYTNAKETKGSIWSIKDGQKVINQEALNEEITARLTEEIINNPTKFLEDISNKTVLKRIAYTLKGLYERAKDFFSSSEKKKVKEAYNTLVKVIKENKQKLKTKTNDIIKKYSLENESPYRSTYPEPRGEITKAKIIRYLKEGIRSNVSKKVFFAKELLKYGNLQDVENNFFYHGTTSAISSALKPSIILDQRYANFGGGYDEKYWGISLSKSRNIASNFSANRAYVTVYDVLLKKDAKVIELPNIEDSVEIEDIIEELWANKIDAVKIGKWNDWASEQEIVILNPNAIVVGESETIKVYNKGKTPNKTSEEIQKMLDDAPKIISEANEKKAQESKEKNNDGIVFKKDTINEIEYDEFYAVFSPNQIKLTTNKNPTKNEDIRYSLDKEYTKKESANIINEIIGKNGITLKGKTVIINKLHTALNTAEEGKRGGIALGIADMIIDNTKNSLTAESKKTLRQGISKEILLAYDKEGKLSQLSKIILKYEGKINELKEALRYEKNSNRVINTIVANVKGLKDYRKGKYINSSFLADPRIEQYAKELSKLERMGNLIKNPNRVVEAINTLSPFYTKEVLDGNGDTNYYNEQIRADIDTITQFKGDKFSINDLKAISRITSHIKHLYTTYNSVFFKGKTQITEAVGTNGKKGLDGISKLHSTMFKPLINPSDFFEMNERYRKGILTDFYNELQTAKENQTKYKRQATEKFKQFFKDNPRYEKSLRELQETGLTKGQSISLWMTYNRKQGKAYLTLKNAKIRIGDDKQARGGNLEKAKLLAQNKTFSKDMLPKLTEIDKRFVEIVQDYFKWSGEEISKVELRKWGFANEKESNYFPISIDGSSIYSILGNDRTNGFMLSKPSFTYKLTEASKGKTLFIGNVLDILNGQINQSSAFVGYAVPINEIAKIYNVKANNTTIKERLREINPYFNEWFNQYLLDIQGIKKNMDFVDRALNISRSWMARSALGLNPKVWFNQLTSIPMAKSVGLKYFNQMKGIYEISKLIKNKKFASEYEHLIDIMPEVWQRYEGNIAVKEALGLQAQNEFDKIMDYATSPIQAFDKFAIMSLWEGCKIQTNNETEATNLLKEILRKTQPNYEAINRSEVLRSKNQVTKMFTMFMTQPLQNFSRLFKATDKSIVAAETKNANLKKEAISELKATLSGFVVQTTAFVLVAQLFKLLLGTKRKDGNGKEISITADTFRDLGGAITGMFPVARDAYTYFTAGWEPSNAAYDGLINIFSSVKDFLAGTEKLLDGKADEQYKINAAYRRVMTSLTQTFGIPLRNLERYTAEIIKNFNADFALKYDSLFYSQQYTTLLKKSIKAGDNSYEIMDKLLQDKGLTSTAFINRELIRLYKEDFDALPKKANTKITNDGKEIELMQWQHTMFKNIYSNSTAVISSLINSKEYKQFTDGEKSKAIKYVYDTYYSKALKSVLNIDDGKSLLLKVLPIKELSLAYAFKSCVETDKNKDGSSVTGSKKEKVLEYINSTKLTRPQKAFLVYYFGYTINDNDIPYTTSLAANKMAKNYIKSLSMKISEKEYLLEFI